jgi:hypothetical protein
MLFDPGIMPSYCLLPAAQLIFYFRLASEVIITWKDKIAKAPLEKLSSSISLYDKIICFM